MSAAKRSIFKAHCLCGRAVRIGSEAESGTCWQCVARRPADPEGACGRGAVEAVRKGCSGLVAGRCVLRESGSCVVLEGKRCGYAERVGLMGPDGAPRTCPDCGAALAPRRRFCPGCDAKRARDRSRQNRNTRHNRQEGP